MADRAQSFQIFAMTFLLVCVAVGAVVGHEVYQIAISMGVPELFAPIAGLGGFFVGTAIIPVGLIGLIEVYDRKNHPVTTFGVEPYHRATETDIEECLNCGVEDTDGYQIEYGRHRVAFGVAFSEIDGGVHEDCKTCHEDAVEAALRRANPARVQDTTERPETLGDPSLAHMQSAPGQEAQ